MDTTASSIDINNYLQTATTFTVSIWTFIIIGILGVAVILLTWMLFKKEKALQLMTFSISPIGLKLTYELNKDEKLKLLLLDNIALQNELKILQTTLNNERWRSFGLLVAFLLTVIVFYVGDKLKFTKTSKPDIEKDTEEIKTSANIV